MTEGAPRSRNWAAPGDSSVGAAVISSAAASARHFSACVQSNSATHLSVWDARCSARGDAREARRLDAFPPLALLPDSPRTNKMKIQIERGRAAFSLSIGAALFICHFCSA